MDDKRDDWEPDETDMDDDDETETVAGALPAGSGTQQGGEAAEDAAIARAVKATGLSAEELIAQAQRVRELETQRVRELENQRGRSNYAPPPAARAAGRAEEGEEGDVITRADAERYAAAAVAEAESRTESIIEQRTVATEGRRLIKSLAHSEDAYGATCPAVKLEAMELIIAGRLRDAQKLKRMTEGQKIAFIEQQARAFIKEDLGATRGAKQNADGKRMKKTADASGVATGGAAQGTEVNLTSSTQQPPARNVVLGFNGEPLMTAQQIAEQTRANLEKYNESLKGGR